MKAKAFELRVFEMEYSSLATPIREKMNLTFEISGQADYMYYSLLNSVDSITVTRPRCHLEPRACVIAADFVFFKEAGVMSRQQPCVGHALYGLGSYVIICRSCYGNL